MMIPDEPFNGIDYLSRQRARLRRRATKYATATYEVAHEFFVSSKVAA